MGIALVVAVLVIGGAAYLALRPKAKVAEEPPPVIVPSIAEEAEKIAKRMPHYVAGDVLIHKETGKEVTIVLAPSIVDAGEYTIRWPSGATGQIHQTQLKNWFTEV